MNKYRFFYILQYNLISRGLKKLINRFQLEIDYFLFFFKSRKRMNGCSINTYNK